MIDLSKISSRINYCTILTTGRTGSDYLQACLDGVPGVLSFGGKFLFYTDFCEEIGSFENHNPNKILDLFISKNPSLFGSDYIENKNLKIDIDKLKKNYSKIVDQKSINRKNFLISLYLSYHLTLDRSVEDLKIMVHHSHSVEETEKFLKDFKNSKILITVRDPRANLKSGLVNWIDYDSKRANQKHLYLYLRRVRDDLVYSQAQTNEKFYVKLEEANEISTKEKLVDFLGVRYSPEIMKATFASKIWGGDKLSKFHSKAGAYNNSVKNNEWENFFTTKDKIILNFLYKDYEIFNYKIGNTNLLKKILIFLIIPIPFSFEKKLNFKYFSGNFFYYLKRVIYLYSVLFNLYNLIYENKTK